MKPSRNAGADVWCILLLFGLDSPKWFLIFFVRPVLITAGNELRVGCYWCYSLKSAIVLAIIERMIYELYASNGIKFPHPYSVWTTPVRTGNYFKSVGVGWNSRKEQNPICQMFSPS